MPGPSNKPVPALESHTEQRVVTWAKHHGITGLKLNLQGNRGWPDRLFLLHNGKPVFMEFKRVGASPTLLQQYNINYLKERGYICEVIHSAAQGIACLARHLNGNHATAR